MFIPWLTSAWSSTDPSPTRRVPITSGLPTPGRSPTLDPARWAHKWIPHQQLLSELNRSCFSRLKCYRLNNGGTSTLIKMKSLMFGLFLDSLTKNKLYNFKYVANLKQLHHQWFVSFKVNIPAGFLLFLVCIFMVYCTHCKFLSIPASSKLNICKNHPTRMRHQHNQTLNITARKSLKCAFFTWLLYFHPFWPKLKLLFVSLSVPWRYVHPQHEVH